MQKRTTAICAFTQLAARLVIALGVGSLASTAHAHVTQIAITTIESPAYGGQAFGSVGTYTRINSGWGLRAAHAGQRVPIVDGCDATGQRIPFAPSAASRQPGAPNAGDPRLSIAERYADSAD